MIDRSKLHPTEIAPKAITDHDKLVAQIKRIAVEIGYVAPRMPGDLAILARCLERRKVMPLRWKPGQPGWSYRGKGPAKLRVFIQRSIPELDYPLIRPTKADGGAVGL